MGNCPSMSYEPKIAAYKLHIQTCLVVRYLS